MEISEYGDIIDYMQLMESEQNALGTFWEEDERPTQHLKLEIGDSFLSSIRLMLAWYRNSSTRIKYTDRSKHEEFKTAPNSPGNSKEVPAELPLLMLSVGSRKLIRTAECDIFARFYYLVKKVVCQMRVGTVSRKVEIPFSDITALHVSFDHRGFDTLSIEVKLPFQSLSADSTCPGKYPGWKVEDPKDAYSFPESKFVFLEIEKGMLDRSLAKLLYTDPSLQRVVNFSRGTYSDRPMHHGRVNAPMQQTIVSALDMFVFQHYFPFHPRVNGNYDLDSSYTG